MWANMSLYHDNDGDNLWRIIGFDMNLSWGAFFLDNPANDQGIQATNDNHKSFPLYGSSQALSLTGGNYNRIYDVIFDVPQTLEMFRRRMRTVLDALVLPPSSAANSSAVEQKVLAWRDLIISDGVVDRAKWGWPESGDKTTSLRPASLPESTTCSIVFLSAPPTLLRQTQRDKHCFAHRHVQDPKCGFPAPAAG